MRSLRKLFVFLVAISIVLPGCQTTGMPNADGSNPPNLIGPQLSSFFDRTLRLGGKQGPTTDPSRPKLDIILPVFNPGLPPNESDYEKQGVWPELRRAEAIRFAYKLRLALEETGAFGAVRVPPDSTATGDLYVLGRIDESDGEDIEIDIQVFDIAGNRWMNESFDHEVDSSFHKNIRNEGKDPYDPVFTEAAEAIVEELTYTKTEKLDEIKRMTDLRFAASFHEEAFAEHLTREGNFFTLASYPSDTDPMLLRTKAIRVRDQLFVDGLQDNYRAFSEKMDTSYRVWQEQSLAELEAKREAQKKAGGEAAVGILAVGLMVAAVAAGANNDNPNAGTAMMTGGVLAGAAGAHGVIARSGSSPYPVSDETHGP